MARILRKSQGMDGISVPSQEPDEAAVREVIQTDDTGIPPGAGSQITIVRRKRQNANGAQASFADLSLDFLAQMA
jgi:hypothetical protein